MQERKKQEIIDGLVNRIWSVGDVVQFARDVIQRIHPPADIAQIALDVVVLLSAYFVCTRSGMTRPMILDELVAIAAIILSAIGPTKVPSSLTVPVVITRLDAVLRNFAQWCIDNASNPPAAFQKVQPLADVWAQIVESAMRFKNCECGKILAITVALLMRASRPSRQ